MKKVIETFYCDENIPEVGKAVRIPEDGFLRKIELLVDVNTKEKSVRVEIEYYNSDVFVPMFYSIAEFEYQWKINFLDLLIGPSLASHDVVKK